MSARSPVLRPRKVAPSVSAESSISARSWRSAIWRSRSQSGTLPIRLGIISALVFGPISASIWSTAMLYVPGITSTNAGRSPCCTSGAIVVAKVSTGVMTSLPLGNCSRATARKFADEPELTMMP